MTCGSPRKIGAAEGEEEEVGSITGPKSSEKSRSGSAGEEKEAAAGVDDGMLRRVSLLASMEWRDIFCRSPEEEEEEEEGNIVFFSLVVFLSLRWRL